MRLISLIFFFGAPLEHISRQNGLTPKEKYILNIEIRLEFIFSKLFLASQRCAQTNTLGLFVYQSLRCGLSTIHQRKMKFATKIRNMFNIKVYLCSLFDIWFFSCFCFRLLVSIFGSVFGHNVQVDVEVEVRFNEKVIFHKMFATMKRNGTKPNIHLD